ncbi:MAG: hypothetical protein R6W93_07615 [Candidatus Limnocylindrales bacterium]|jgi:hypothetical protein
MTPLELVLFGAACYVFGLVSGATLIPWLVDRGLFPPAGMTDDRHPPSEYRWARQVSAVLLIAVVVLVVVLDVIVEGYEVSPPVLVPLLLTAAGLLSVDLPRVRP